MDFLIKQPSDSQLTILFFYGYGEQIIAKRSGIYHVNAKRGLFYPDFPKQPIGYDWAVFYASKEWTQMSSFLLSSSINLVGLDRFLNRTEV